MRYRHSSFGLTIVHHMHYHQPERTDRPMPVLPHDHLSVALADSQVVDYCRPKTATYDSSLDEIRNYMHHKSVA